MYPLCETDYFARLDLICASCKQALRSSYITACGEKYHVEHFTCSECDTLFGPNDSYYEHSGRVCESSLLYTSHAHFRLSFPLLYQIRGQVCRMRDGDSEAVCRDEQEWKG